MPCLVFGGRHYEFNRAYCKKSAAAGRARSIRRKGKLARVVRRKDHYIVYASTKGKNSFRG
jgi:archaeosine-15-forming tRNA-guanine transglycosylase